MQTRREVLVNFASMTTVAGLSRASSPARGIEILAEDHCLSKESARGFKLLPCQSISSRVIVLPGMRELSRESALVLRRHAEGGGWLILESGLVFTTAEQAARQIEVFRDVFRFQVSQPVSIQDGDTAYLRYTWPVRHLVRHFSAIAPIKCLHSEMIGEFEGTGVCARRCIGKGGVILLGSMLGPGIAAHEREALEVGTAMLRSL